MKTTNLRIPDELHEKIKWSAKYFRRSLNSEILQAIDFYLSSREIRHELPHKPEKKTQKTKQG